jgi:prevent-host-death family protein
MGYRSAFAVNGVLRSGAAGPILVKLTNSVASDLMDETVNLYQAKTHLSRLVERAANGEEIVIAKGGKPKAKLVPLGESAPQREPANLLGITFIAEDFDEPLPPEIQSAFEADQ